MFLNFTIINQVVVLFLIMGVGFALSKKRVLDEGSIGKLSFLLCYIIQPCVIFAAFQVKKSGNLLNSFLSAGAIAIGIHLFFITLSLLIYNKRFVKDEGTRNALQFACVYTNSGFMGFPLLESTLGHKGVFLGTGYNSIFNFFVWTHGISRFSEKFGRRSLKNIFLNPNIIAAVLGLVTFLLGFSLPLPLNLAISELAKMNTPLSMIVIGTTISKIPFREFFSCAEAWVNLVFRNFVFPVLVLVILRSLRVDRDVLTCSVLVAACPTGTMGVLLAKLKGKDETLLCKIMTLSTVSSLVSLPLILGLTRIAFALF